MSDDDKRVEVEYGHYERKSDRPFDPNFDYVYEGATRSDSTYWRNVIRHVTPWRPVENEEEA
jgi:hypothetical protein